MSLELSFSLLHTMKLNVTLIKIFDHLHKVIVSCNGMKVHAMLQ